MKKLITAAATALITMAGGAFADGHASYPERPIMMMVSYGAGGRGGWNWFATQAEADGYTLGAYNIPHFIAQSIEGGVSYTSESFEPIANWGADPAVFVVNTDSAFTSMADVVDYA